MNDRDAVHKLCVIIAGGDVQEEMIHPEGALVVCADGGYRHAKAQGFVPDAIVGDFDSWTEPLPEGVKIVMHPPEKDETDTWLAIEYGRAQGCTNFVIYGALGGERIDHAIANIQLLHRMTAEGLNGTLCCGKQSLFVQDFSQEPELEVFLGEGAGFSLFSLTDLCTDVSLVGAKYPLEHAVLRNNCPLGVSNEVAKGYDCITISASSGMMLMVW